MVKQRWINVALVVSLVLNLLVAGAFFGAVVKGPQRSSRTLGLGHKNARYQHP